MEQTERLTGFVDRAQWSRSGGFAFVKCDLRGQHYFTHSSDYPGRSLQPVGTRIAFSPSPNDRGREPRATWVEILEDETKGLQ